MTPCPQAHRHSVYEDDVFRRESRVTPPHHHPPKLAARLLLISRLERILCAEDYLWEPIEQR